MHRRTWWTLTWIICDQLLCRVFSEAEATRGSSAAPLTGEFTCAEEKDKTGQTSNTRRHYTVDSLRFSSCNKSGAMTGGAARRRTSLWSSTRAGGRGSSPESPEPGSCPFPYSWLIRLKMSPFLSSSESSSRCPPVFSRYLKDASLTARRRRCFLYACWTTTAATSSCFLRRVLLIGSYDTWR